MTKILLVDDTISFHSLVELFLRQSTIQRYELASVVSAEAMFQYLKSTNVDLILLDISLPDMNGITACQKARQQYPDLPIILITAKLDHSLAVVASEAGASDFLLKPFDGTSLRYRIQHALTREVSV